MGPLGVVFLRLGSILGCSIILYTIMLYTRNLIVYWDVHLFHILLNEYLNQIFLIQILFWFKSYFDHRPCVHTQHTPAEVCDTYHVIQFFYYSYLLYLVCFFFLLPFFLLFGYVWGMTPIMRSINILKIDSLFDLVKKSPIILSLGHHYTEISPLWILSVTKNIWCQYVWCVFWLMTYHYFPEE